MRVETLAEQLFFTTVPVFATSADTSWRGTAFLAGLQDHSDRTLPVLVTNKHVVEGANSLKVGLHSSTPKRRQWRPGKGWLIDIDPRSWIAHPNPLVDIAALPAGPFLFGSDSKGRSPFFRSLGSELFATDERIEELDALEDVVFVGYPAGLSDSANNTPIVRRGLTATPISLDYEGLPAFLIDASVFPGSSGSPVFLWNPGTYRNRSGGVVVGSRFFLLGILAAVHVRKLIADVVPVPTRAAAVFDEPIDLGIVYKASAIWEVLVRVAQQHGFTPV